MPERITVHLGEHAIRRIRERTGLSGNPDLQSTKDLLATLNRNLNHGRISANENELGTHILGFEQYRTIFVLRKDERRRYQAATYESTIHKIVGRPVAIRYDAPLQEPTKETHVPVVAQSPLDVFRVVGLDRLITIDTDIVTGRPTYSIKGKRTWPHVFHQEATLTPGQWFTQNQLQEANAFKEWLESTLHKPCNITCRMTRMGIAHLTVEIEEKVTVTIQTYRPRIRLANSYRNHAQQTRCT